MPIVLNDKKQEYLQKLNALNAKCKMCVRKGRFVSNVRCDLCHIGKAVRWLEAEYADVTGWSHKKW